MIGTTIEHYRIVERLGQGGMGAVYRATDTLLEREVALKLLRPEYAADPQFAERFRAEAVMLAKLSHHNIATLFGFVRDSRQLCMVMELATGETLGNLLKRTGALSWDRAILLTGQMLDALQYAHERGVVHRDIKPSNLMVGQNDHLKLMDFGIARLMGTTRVTQMGFTVGTLEYMAPEQIRGEDVDGRADIYATGVVLYEMVTGQLPFKSSREQTLMFAHLQQEVVPPRTYRPNLPWHLSDVIVRALSKAPGDRFATAREFSDALGASPSATTVAIRVPNGQTVSGTAASPRRRTSVSRAVAGGGVVQTGADDDTTRIAPTPGVQKRGWFARWWPQLRLSSNRFGGAQEPGVMYQAAVGAGGFGGAIRVVAVRMGTAGRKAATRVTDAFIGAGHLFVRRPVFIALLLIGLAGGGWYWRQRQATASGDPAAPKQASVLPIAAPPAAAASAPVPATVPVSAPAVVPAAVSTPNAPSAPPSEPPPAVSAPAAGAAAPAPPTSASAAPATSGPAAPPAPRTSAPATSPVATPVPAPAASSTQTVNSPAVVESRVPATKLPAAVEPSRTAYSATREPVKPPTVSPLPTSVAEKAPIPAEPDIKLENDVTLLTPKNDDVEETDGHLVFHGNEIVIIDGDDKVVRTVRLRADGPGRGPAASGPARIFSHRRTRWLVLPVGADQFVVQVDRDDVPKLTEVLEARLGRPVTTVDGEPQFPKR